MSARPVTTTDLLKFAGLVFVLVDHFGAYFVADETWWRLLGRLAAPIFFFLIGFARSRAVPWIWLVFGVVLTATDALESGSLGDATLNILLNFALLRGALLPLAEAWVLPSAWRTAALVAVCVLLIPSTDHLIEYGTAGWLWALAGLAHRRALDQPDRLGAWIRTAIAAVTGAAYAGREIDDFAFDALQAAALLGLVAGLVLLLLRFRRTESGWQPGPAVAAGLQVGGRYSLEIYALSLFAMQVVAYAMEAGEEDDEAA